MRPAAAKPDAAHIDRALPRLRVVIAAIRAGHESRSTSLLGYLPRFLPCKIRSMNLLDVLIILIVVSQSAWWARSGLTHGLFSLGGFWLGFVGGAALSPFALELSDDPLLKLVGVVAIIFGAAFITGSIGQLIGNKLSVLTRKLRLGIVDGVLGALFGAAVTLVIVWLLASIMSGVPFREVNRQIRNSTVLHTMNNVLPDAPALISRIGGLIEPHGFPRAFIGLEPRPVEPVEQPSTAEVAAAIDAAGTSTVRLEGAGCGGLITGSGFVAANGLVVTNAHVVAGIENPDIVDVNGIHAGEVVYFDPELDIAVIRTSGLAGSPLPISREIHSRGDGTVALGYPGGGRLTGTPAGILRQIDARGLDIYGQKAVMRSTYELQTKVVSGNSGGPVVLPDGTVVGLVFARSDSEPGIGYALVSPDILAAVRHARDVSQPVASGKCAPR